MNCPNPKHRKAVVLKTRRTDANGTRVRRVRICPKCRETFVSVEVPQTEYEAEQATHMAELRAERGKVEQLEHQLEALGRFREVLSAFIHGENISGYSGYDPDDD